MGESGKDAATHALAQIECLGVNGLLHPYYRLAAGSRAIGTTSLT